MKSRSPGAFADRGPGFPQIQKQPLFPLFGKNGCSDCQKTLPGGLEGRSPPNVIRIRRHVRRMRKPCLARFPCAVSRPGVPQGREGNSVQLSEKDAVGGLFRHAEQPLFPPFGKSGWLCYAIYLANSVLRVSRMTLTLICPGYSSSFSMRLAISRASTYVPSSEISSGLTMMRTSRPD